MRRLLLVPLLLGAISAWAAADSVPIIHDECEEDLGSFVGSITYDTGVLTIELENTSPASNGGFITGFLFNIAGDATATYNDGDIPATPEDEDPFDDTPSESGSPYGTFEFGAALGGDFLGGGSPVNGIAVGETATFVFTVAGPDAGTLTAADFISELSTGGGKSAAFLVRFKGFEDEGSDKCTGVIIPLPSALYSGAATLALLGVFGLKRKFSH